MTFLNSPDTPSQFYTGLVAELYEPLISERPRADDYVPFLERSGTPALELACGSGLLMVELVGRGYEVEGLDASQDLLDRCRARAAREGLEVTVHHAEMQSFSLTRRYRSIFLAGASFSLLTTDEDAAACLERIYDHLQRGGSTSIPLYIPDREAVQSSLHDFREVTNEAGERLRVGMVAFEPSTDGRSLCRRLRYERVSPGGKLESVERDWHTRWWSQEDFRTMLRSAGFRKVRLVARGGGKALQEARLFVARAHR